MMFGYLKKKLKGAVSRFSKEADEEAVPVETEESTEVVDKEATNEKTKEPKTEVPETKEPEAPETIPEVPETKEKKEVDVHTKEPEKKEKTIKDTQDTSQETKDSDEITKDFDEVEEGLEKDEKKLGFFGRVKDAITKRSLSEAKFEEIFFDIEMALLENNVAVEVIEKIKLDLKTNLVDQKVLRGKITDLVTKSLRESISEVLSAKPIDILDVKKPYIIAFLGINGTGKTTSLAKVAHYLKKNNKTCVIAAADTFRAAAIDQLNEHAKNLGIKIIKYDYGSDPAAVAYEGVQYAKAHDIDYVLIDTAGRQHSNVNLMGELKKIIRVSDPDLKVFVGDSLTGNDCVEQARMFDEAIEVDANILTKADADDKGGAPLSVSYITKKPILFFGTGQGYDDLEVFNKEKLLERLEL